MAEAKKKKYLKIIKVYNKIVDGAGELAPHLGKEYFVENTIHQCKHDGIEKVGRRTVYRALKLEKELKQEEVFLNEEH